MEWSAYISALFRNITINVMVLALNGGLSNRHTPKMPRQHDAYSETQNDAKNVYQYVG